MLLKNIVKCSSKGRLLSTQVMTGAEMIQSCNDYTIWSWSAQKQVDPIAMTKAEVCFFVFTCSREKYNNCSTFMFNRGFTFGMLIIKSILISTVSWCVRTSGISILKLFKQSKINAMNLFLQVVFLISHVESLCAFIN